MTPFERGLRAAARSLDQASLEALASRGLVRRAQKDLERGVSVVVAGSEPTRVTLRVGEWEVAVDEHGWARARCGCPAEGVCQHVVMAVLFLQEDQGPTSAGPGEPPGVPADPFREWMDISADALAQWAGAPAYRKGLTLAAGVEAEVEVGTVVHVRFRARNVEVRFVPGSGLEGAITSGPRVGDESGWVVAALVQLQRSRGADWRLPATGGALVPDAGAPRSREEVLTACQRLAREMAAQGLARLSASIEPRLMTIAMSALAVNLPRLSHLLRAIACEVAACRNRDARGDSARLLARLAESEALCEALKRDGGSASPELVGTHRARFEEVGTIEISGIAAWPWETASGYVGLTVLFWDDSARSWNTWSEVRPRSDAAGFEPVARFGHPGPWAGVDSPRQAVRSRLRLMRARRTGSGRLSASTQSRCLVLGASQPASCGVPILDDWSGLDAIWRRAQSAGLRPDDPRARIVALRIHSTGTRRFDEVRQTLVWPCADLSGIGIPLELAFTPRSETAIRCLESLDPAALTGAVVVGRLERSGRALALVPFVVYPPSAPGIQLGFAKAAVSPPQADRMVGEQDADDATGNQADSGEGEESRQGEDSDPALATVLDKVDAVLVAIAEGGTAGAGRKAIDALAPLVGQLRGFGLGGLATCLARISEAHANGTGLLRAAYVSSVLRRLGSRGPTPSEAARWSP